MFSTAIRLLTSLLMLWATPGYWIFMATSRPPFMRARCTCPMEAAAKGRSSKYSSLSRQLGPRSLLRVFVICFSGMKSALCLTRSKILARWGLMKASSWMLSIWPSLSAAPRTLHSVFTMRSALASDRKGLESSTAFFPERSSGRRLFLATSARAPKPRPTARPPKLASRPILVTGTFRSRARSLSVCLWGLLSGRALACRAFSMSSAVRPPTGDWSWWKNLR